MGGKKDKGGNEKGGGWPREDGGKSRDNGGGDKWGEKGTTKGGWPDERKGGWQDGKGGEKGERKGFEKGEWQDERKGGWQDGKGGEKGDRKGFEKGEKGEKGKGKAPRPEKLVSQGLRGIVISFIKDKPSGFLQRSDGERDVFFDITDVIGGESVELYDAVEFDVVEGNDRKLYAARLKKVPKDTPQDKNTLKSSTPLTASTAGSLTGSLGLAAKKGSLTGGFSGGLAKKGGGGLSGGLTASTPGSLTGSLLKSGGILSGGGLGGKAKLEDANADGAADGEEDEEEGVVWGRVVSTRERFGFLQRLGSSDTGDVFFRAADVSGMGSNDPGERANGIEITMPNGRNSMGHTKFYLNIDDEVSFTMSKDHTGKPCAADICKEKKGAWRTGRRTQLGGRSTAHRQETVKDQMNRLLEMGADQVLHNASLFKEILESPQFDPSHLCKIVSLLASQDLAEDDRADPLYRIFLDSSAMKTMLRTNIIKHSAGQHSGTFLVECLKCLVEVVVRHPTPQSLRGQLPLVELVEAWEMSVREGSSATKKGLPDDVRHMLMCLQKKFPDDVNLDRLFGVRAKKDVRSAAEEYSELLEADHYMDMPILPTSAEMLGQCAFELSENMRTYEKVEDYVQTHFMLLREDYVEPLRAGIKLYMQGRHSPKDLHVYTDVKVVGMLSTWEGVVYRVELPKAQVKKIKWDSSKQLMYGSLLCLSDDSFETLIWATVWRRDAEMMSAEGQLDIRLPFETFDDRLSPGKSFCCIENVTIYFEAYRHVLIALQSMRPSDLPFQQIFLSPQPLPVPPTFLKADTDMFHFHNVFHSCEKPDAVVSAPRSFKILQEWPSTLLQALDIDPTQLDAIRHAMTSAVALIQGPPGTGKTWVGLKIVQALLENTREVRYSPILVVCYTNHALDQFLEGIFKFCEKIARIGSRSKSEIMQTRNLKELVGELKPSKEYYQARKSLNDRRDRLREDFGKMLELVDSHTVGVKSGRNILKEKEFEAFYQGYLDYLAEDAGKVTSVYEDDDAVDDELWTKMMKAWLETSHFEKLAPVMKQSAGGLPTLDKLKGGVSDDDVDAEEEEAEQEQHERKLDVEQVGEKKNGGMGDFYAEIKNAWLPYWEEHQGRMSLDLLSFTWSDHAEALWLLPREKRHETYRQWLLEQHHEAREQLPEMSRLLERNADSRAALERDRKLELLREMQIVGMTTTAVSKYQSLLRELRPEIVIVEEAAEVLEAHILTALHARTQHVILIGDHQQLRPGTAVYRLSKSFHLDVSLFERLIKNGADHVTLLQQRRMHPKISRLMRQLYPNLRDHESTYKRPEVMGVKQRTFFLRHNKMEDDEGESHSKTNTWEASFIAALCSHLVQSGYDETQITVLTPYLGQVRTLKNKIRRDPALQNMLITAVDNYQGEENDIIVISLVRSNRNKSVGFLAVDNRVNVALTRARCGMFILGNADMLKTSLWSSIISELQSDGSFGERMPLIDKDSGCVHEVKSADDISVLLKDPLHQTYGEGEGSFGVVAERWAQLGQDEGKGGKGRDRRAYNDDRSAKTQSSARDGNMGSRQDANDEWPPKSGAAARRGPGALSSAESAPKRDVAPPPTKLAAKGDLEECELVHGRADLDEATAGDDGKKSTKKKQKSNATGKVVMKWG
mmetsp:Transcript_122580/g.392305  ORF Transcript_122580/g.392305 Transcript_122580/m.392305 type:complete len:1641 (+) Transcript_122580:598-5520(+)